MCDIDYRKRCVVVHIDMDYQVLCYGLSASEYNAIRCMDNRACWDTEDKFDHSAGRGLSPGQRGITVAPSPHFFTAGLGRHDEVRLRMAEEKRRRILERTERALAETAERQARPHRSRGGTI